MSNYGPPPGAPQDPSGQPLPPTPPPAPAYGQPSAPPPPPAPGYGAPAAPGYGAAPAGYGYGAPTPPYASWGARAGAFIIDGLVGAVAMIPFWIGYGLLIGGAAAGGVAEYDPNTGMYTDAGEPNGALMAIGGLLMFIGFLVSLAFLFWNYGLKQGKTGYSIGKGVLGIKVVKEADGQVLGTWFSIGRFFVHYLDQLACYIGYLWPLWDDKRQTFADKILSTIVIIEPKK
ncbi:RDD family protein [Nocardioides sp. NBC_00163]|uniref:RDD family protein n=1 Tax=Nocardioides sp. NBC_00163 TaxID=2975999 RepID=UPI0032465D27